MKTEYGRTRVDINDVEYESFSDMSFWTKHVPENCVFIDVTICHETGYYDEPDMTWFSVNWRKN
jgi:hypothetical protein